MKNSEIRDTLTFREQLACSVLSKLKWRFLPGSDTDTEFYPCKWNDTVMAIACWLLKGRDPEDFTISLLTRSGELRSSEDVIEVRDQFSKLNR